MSETANIRMERITRLLHELRYEVERGMLEGDVDETIGFDFVVPISKVIPDGVVLCHFRTRPVPRYMMGSDLIEPRLKLIAGGKR